MRVEPLRLKRDHMVIKCRNKKRFNDVRNLISAWEIIRKRKFCVIHEDTKRIDVLPYYDPFFMISEVQVILFMNYKVIKEKYYYRNGMIFARREYE